MYLPSISICSGVWVLHGNVPLTTADDLLLTSTAMGTLWTSDKRLCIEMMLDQSTMNNVERLSLHDEIKRLTLFCMTHPGEEE